MYGTVIVIEDIKFDKEFGKNEFTALNQQDAKKEVNEDEFNKNYYQFGLFFGQVTSTVKDGCKGAFINGEPRLYESVYLCTFQIEAIHIGKIYGVINKRRGEIINETSNDEGLICNIEATIPVYESDGFVTEIRKKSSGLANPMLEFYKWQILKIDPFYIPKTKEELEEYGVNIDTPNIAKKIINLIRTRKGLPTDEKLIKDANKQSNLGKNK